MSAAIETSAALATSVLWRLNLWLSNVSCLQHTSLPCSINCDGPWWFVLVPLQ